MSNVVLDASAILSAVPVGISRTAYYNPFGPVGSPNRLPGTTIPNGGADVIMLDEPTAGMSHSETDYIVDLIRQVTVGKTLIMVEHDMGVVFGLADRISVLVYGEIIASGAPEEIRGNRNVQVAYLGKEAA